MTKKFAIAARDHGAGVAQQGFDRMAGRGRLPFVAAEAADTEDDLRDFLLGHSGAHAVKGLKHAADASALLPRQARVGCYDATVERRQQARDSFNAIEAISAERNERNERLGIRFRFAMQKLQTLAVPDFVDLVQTRFIRARILSCNGRMFVAAIREDRWRRRQNDDAQIGLREPEDRRGGRGARRIDREIAAPNVGGTYRSAGLNRRQYARIPRNPVHNRHCDEAIPMQGPRRINLRCGRNRPTSAIGTDLGS